MFGRAEAVRKEPSLHEEADGMSIDQLIALLALIVMIIGLAVNKGKS
ncbi:hypothetical protein [Paenibacillus lemnae]|uniref:Uncharacterized protein n=1 Tax=Paenibacillus lemnae TaxID=1330551 RepID=A0A848MD30_PAELE|nr:hypothetical protein [Paenibacillus lemnae]NMO97942.1 hypothetical protein [Paenibacillus lemnae]